MLIKIEELKKILFQIEIGNDQFWKFINGKIKSYPVAADEFGWGCFPIIKEERLQDIIVLVPNIVDKQTLLINIHEFAHAFELYQKLGELYEEDVEKSEMYAKKKEKEYLDFCN